MTDLGFTLPPSQDDTDMHCQAVVSYTLRLPTYRSSYIRRYHPYARFITLVVEDGHSDGACPNTGEPPLDLSILEQRVPLPPDAAPAVAPNDDLHAAINVHNGQVVDFPEGGPAPVINVGRNLLNDVEYGGQDDRDRDIEARAKAIRPLLRVDALVASLEALDFS